jgi:alginate O-acetyltransferase complex protein AlgI
MTDYRLTIFIMFAVAILIYRGTASRLSSARPAILLLINIVFISLMGDAVSSPHLAAYVVGIAGIGAAIAFGRKGGGGRMAFMFGLIAVTAVMFAFKYPFYTAALLGEHPLLQAAAATPWIGLSYMTFRAVDYLVWEAELSGSSRPAVMPLLCYLTFFPAFVSGPINRFSTFLEDIAAPLRPLSWEEVRSGLFRGALGVIKVLWLSRIAYENSAYPHDFYSTDLTWERLALGLYANLLYIYSDFSGYCDIIISVAKFMGISLPENFRMPFLAANIQDFWNRWHVSLTHWCRDYIFFPVLRQIMMRAPGGNRLAASVIAVLVTFFLIGAWHGDSARWALYGLYHGVGVATTTVYAYAFDALWPGRHGILQANFVYRLMTTLLTISFVSFGLVLTVDEFARQHLSVWLFQ